MTERALKSAQAPKRSDTDPFIKKLKAVAVHPKVPKLAGRVALGIANHRTRVSDWSERTLREPAGRLEARADARQAEMEQRLAGQNERFKERFGDQVQPPLDSAPVAPQALTEPVPSLAPQELNHPDIQ